MIRSMRTRRSGENDEEAEGSRNFLEGGKVKEGGGTHSDLGLGFFWGNCIVQRATFVLKSNEVMFKSKGEETPSSKGVEVHTSGRRLKRKNYATGFGLL